MKYKKSSIRWETLIPTHWDEIKGKHVFVSEKEIIGDDWINEQRISLTYGGVIPRDNDDVSGLNPSSLSTYQVVKENDLLFKLIDLENEKTSRVGLSEYNGITSSAYIRINVKDMHPKYYYYWYYSLWFRYIYNRLGNGVRSTLNAKDLLNLRVPVPPKNEQIKISETIDGSIIKIDRLIQIQERQIENLKEYKQSLVSNIFKNRVWDRIEEDTYREQKYKPIHQLCKIIRGNSPYTKDDLSESGDYVGLQYGKTYKVEIVDDNFDFYVSDKFMKKDQIVIHDDVILISTSETIEDLGHTCYYARNDEGLLGGEQFVLRPSANNIKGKYLYYASLVFTKKLKKYHTGLKVYRFNSNHINNIFLDIHSFSEQEKTIKYLDKKFNQINTLIRHTTDKIEKLNEYKKSLIYEYVTGKKGI